MKKKIKLPKERDPNQDKFLGPCKPKVFIDEKKEASKKKCRKKND